MIRGRREFLMVGGGVIATLGFPRAVSAGRVEIIEMKGTARGEHVWFAPIGLAVEPGTALRFINRDPGNSHTATAYHPDIFSRHRRIPAKAAPWDSDFLLPDGSFEVTLTVPGVYDYYCVPHEMAGMVGRIVVGQPGTRGWEGPAGDSGDLEPEALAGFPSVEDILAQGRIAQEEHE
ncbi:plastocyanin/azurin family copper-binding protein [Ruegeria aquimaris]|uniref:Plastocyanin/azurin family copper-binding protein n=1 Tax=Ruegeria aquimaris TaxID=2984333 RepID=A0ABT3AP49_9RHOB|nr:plastocyanin/azurin family copper-binding protein [Ruegeria sp. XHP0148]MCV2890443.1 plastocyanin/azurin family copper-binding protein [Ruegeria sp. XHP0148]